MEIEGSERGECLQAPGVYKYTSVLVYCARVLLCARSVTCVGVRLCVCVNERERKTRDKESVSERRVISHQQSAISRL